MKRPIRFSMFMASLWVLLAGISCKKNDQYQQSTTVAAYHGSIYDYLQQNRSTFDSVIYVLNRSGLSDSLKKGPYTFFAPTDQSLLGAMAAYNLVLKTRGEAPVSLKNIDSSSWRIIMGRYIVQGTWHLADFKGQDGEKLTTVVRRFMYGISAPLAASGIAGAAGDGITYAYTNGSRFTKDWLTAQVSTADIQAENGVIHILQSAHLVGYNYFINKADTIQNDYSENQTYASGTAAFPNLTSQTWSLKLKKMRAVGANTVELEMANRLDSGYLMRLTILPTDSVLISAAPGSVKQEVQANGPCYLDPATLTFNLNYSYQRPDGMVKIAETINYIAQ